MSAPSKVRSRTFCYCIPSRAGVILLGIIGLVGGAGVTAVGIINIKRQDGSRTSAIIQIIIYLLLAILSIFGLIGAISRRLAFIRMYLAMLIIHLLFNIGSGSFAIYRDFKDAPKYISDCTSGSEDPSVIKACNNAAGIVKGMMIGVFILAWFIESWAVAIVSKYNKQLGEEELAKTTVKDTESW